MQWSQRMIEASKRFEIKNPPFPITIIVRESPYEGQSPVMRSLGGCDYIEIYITCVVPDTNTGIPTKTKHVVELHRHSVDRPEDLWREMFNTVQHAMIHEAMEACRVDGRHFRDPHPEEKHDS